MKNIVSYMHVAFLKFILNARVGNKQAIKLIFQHFSKRCSENEVGRITVEFDSVVQKYFKQL